MIDRLFQRFNTCLPNVLKRGTSYKNLGVSLSFEIQNTQPQVITKIADLKSKILKCYDLAANQQMAKKEFETFNTLRKTVKKGIENLDVADQKKRKGTARTRLGAS